MNKAFVNNKKLAESLQTLEFDLRDNSYAHIAFAIVDDIRLKREAVAELGERLSGKYEFYEFDFLKNPEESLPRFIRSIRRNKLPCAVFAYNLDKLKATDEAKYHIVINSLNAHREDIRDTKSSVVLWVNSETRADLSQYAPDFSDWRTSEASFALDNGYRIAETALGALSLIEAESLRNQAQRIEEALNFTNMKPAMQAELNKQLASGCN
jgi:hypothetical protein